MSLQSASLTIHNPSSAPLPNEARNESRCSALCPIIYNSALPVFLALGMTLTILAAKNVQTEMNRDNLWAATSFNSLAVLLRLHAKLHPSSKFSTFTKLTSTVLSGLTCLSAIMDNYIVNRNFTIIVPFLCTTPIAGVLDSFIYE